MRSTFYGLEVARSGLYTAQNELNTTGHNIANVDTIGFTRQRLLTAALPALSMNVQISVDTHATAGRGVTAITVDQIRSAFTDAKYRVEASVTGYWETFANEFSLVEQIFNNALEGQGLSTSVDAALKEFKAALAAVHNEKTNDLSLRTSLQQAAIKLTESFNYAYGKLEEMHNNTNDAIAVQVDRINEIADSMAMLNKQIFGYELTGSKANDLRDQRNLLLDELAGFVDVEYYENGKGQLVVSIGGKELVSGAEFHKLTVGYEGENKLDVEGGVVPVGKTYTIHWADGLGNPKERLFFTSGSLQALFDIRDGSTVDNIGLPYVAQQLNDLCRKIASEINEVHRQGYTLPYYVEDTLGMDDEIYHSMLANGQADVNAQGKYLWLSPPQTKFDANGKEYYVSHQGVDFFYAGSDDSYKTVTAKNFRLSDAVLNNPSLIAASTKEVLAPDDGWTNINQLLGDVDNILNITNLWSKENELGQSDNFVSVLTGITVMVANRQKHLDTTYSAQSIRIKAIVQERASVSEVSLDEEMTNVVRFTHAYNASARVITAIDEELDTLINRMGRVGL